MSLRPIKTIRCNFEVVNMYFSKYRNRNALNKKYFFEWWSRVQYCKVTACNCRCLWFDLLKWRSNSSMQYGIPKWQLLDKCCYTLFCKLKIIIRQLTLALTIVNLNDLDNIFTQNASKLPFLVQVANFRKKNIFGYMKP